jgi:uncharacterized protein (DUF2062 family)
MRLNFQKLYQKVKEPFQQGLHWKAVTKAIIISLLFTIIPIYGVTTIILTFIAIKFKLNLPIMIVTSYLATPLQFMLFLPFIHIGESIMNTSHTLLTVQDIKAAFDVSFFDTIRRLLFELICGLSGWLLIVLPLGFITMTLLKTKTN